MWEELRDEGEELTARAGEGGIVTVSAGFCLGEGGWASAATTGGLGECVLEEVLNDKESGVGLGTATGDGTFAVAAAAGVTIAAGVAAAGAVAGDGVAVGAGVTAAAAKVLTSGGTLVRGGMGGGGPAWTGTDATATLAWLGMGAAATGLTSGLECELSLGFVTGTSTGTAACSGEVIGSEL